ncbi:hypothetical protein ACOSQ3_006991 [Xanthoceras sorbifolium]
MVQIWGTVGHVDIEAIRENKFVFYFSRLEDRATVRSRGPWHFDHCLLVLQKPEGPGDISKMDFNYVEFWIQIYDVPLMCMNRQIVRRLYKMVGVVVEIPMEGRECWRTFIRVKVGVDISRPLKMRIKVWLEDFESMIIAPIKYERLPKYCYVCGMMRHAMRECLDVDEKKKVIERGQIKFGSWLKALLPIRVRNFKQRENVPGNSRFNQSKKKESPRANMVEGSNHIVISKSKKVEKLALIEAKWVSSCRDLVVGNHKSFEISTKKVLKKEERVGDSGDVKVGEDKIAEDMDGLEDDFDWRRFSESGSK